MRKYFSLSLLALIFSSLTLLVSPSEAIAAEPEVREWTFLIFINGNNNLDSFGDDDLNELEQVGSTDHLHVVVQWASLQRRDVRRMYVTKDSQPQRVNSIELANLGPVDMGDWHRLVDFVEWGVKNFPAKRYFIDVWNHGSGWHRDHLFSKRTDVFFPTDISHDDISGHAITTVELGLAMQAAATAIGHKVDLYGSDACLMGMLEVASQMADAVEYFVGSEEVEPAPGWAYGDFLKEWITKPLRPTIEVAKILTRTYVRSYEGGSQGRNQVTLSAFDLKRMGAIEHAFTELAQALATLPSAALAEIRGRLAQTQTFYFDDYADLGDFLNRLEEGRHVQLRTPEFRARIQSLRAELQNFVISNETTQSYARAQGAALWLPYSRALLNDFAPAYALLTFEKTTGWLAALQKLWE